MVLAPSDQPAGGQPAGSGETRPIALGGGRHAAFAMPAPHPAHAASFVLGVRKCGSSIMNSMVMALARREGVGFLDIGGLFFKQDIAEGDWCADPAIRGLLTPGLCHGGFRTMPAGFLGDPVFTSGRKILLLRDPRDALVSEYFSIAYTHKLPREAEPGGMRDYLLAEREAALAMELESFVLRRAAALNATMLGYRPMLRDKLTRIFFYEDVILQKRQWLLDIAAHFLWQPPPERALAHILSWADVVPATEAPRKFIRRVRPGDHREKLRPGVIGRLNQMLEPAMGVFGYR